ncbi:hypothetical protein HN385_06760 [archaeon]|jgi:hypothetical protein|nr:hypothetical protein [archaeon]MBT3450703.1 hypothetical protein [archaeon]MBT6869195.1 hypothetical protein [archaeon]MBT7193731.1 hypothetical protein [archaeon]MBT7381378.1 hypothetical protein [archaeon]
MKRIEPSLDKICRTEHKDWNNEKVKNQLRLLKENNLDFISQPIYLTKHQNDDNYFVYDGNTRTFLAEEKIIHPTNFQLLESDEDLQFVRLSMDEIYWPGQNLKSVSGYLKFITEKMNYFR